MSQVKLIAFYLPQFHPFEENNKWWGKGFTEWTNVTKAQQLHAEHYQPHLPTDLGFYDLRVRETRLEQIEMAKQYGVDGFCYHYYWFSGHKLMQRPLEEMFADSEANFPFCINWANENWTRRWDASEQEILISQKYNENDDIDFIDSIIPYFKDPRYIKINGAPLLMVYRPQHLPDSKKSVQIWKKRCAEQGIKDIHVCCALTHGNDDYELYGFDGGVEFPPHNLKIPSIGHNFIFHKPFSGTAYNFKDVANYYLTKKYKSPNIFKTVFPSWDNTARVGSRALFIGGGEPHNYQLWLSQTIQKTKSDFPDSERFVFINAWNEWAEGCHLEPDRKYGKAFLEATKKAKEGIEINPVYIDGRPQYGIIKSIKLLTMSQLLLSLKFCIKKVPYTVEAYRFIKNKVFN